MNDARIGKQRLRGQGRFGVVISHTRHPDGENRELLAIDLLENVVKHHTGAVPTTGSRGREQEHQPHLVRGVVEGRLEIASLTRLGAPEVLLFAIYHSYSQILNLLYT